MSVYKLEKPSRPDFAALAVEQAYRVNERSAVDGVDSPVDRVKVEADVWPVVVLEHDRHAGGDGERQELPVVLAGGHEVHLECCTAQPRQKHVQVNQDRVVCLELDVRVSQCSHDPIVGGA